MVSPLMRTLCWVLTKWSVGVMAGLLLVGSGLSGVEVMGEVGLFELAVYDGTTAQVRGARSPPRLVGVAASDRPRLVARVDSALTPFRTSA